MQRRRKELRFVASAIAYWRESEVEAQYLVAAEDSDSGGRTIEVQRSSAEEADNERSFRVGGHCLVVDGGPTSYRCVERWAISDSTIVIRLTAAGSNELGVTTIRIEVPEDAVAVTASALHQLIDDGPEVDDFTVVRRQ